MRIKRHSEGFLRRISATGECFTQIDTTVRPNPNPPPLASTAIVNAAGEIQQLNRCNGQLTEESVIRTETAEPSSDEEVFVRNRKKVRVYRLGNFERKLRFNKQPLRTPPPKKRGFINSQK